MSDGLLARVSKCGRLANTTPPLKAIVFWKPSAAVSIWNGILLWKAPVLLIAATYRPAGALLRGIVTVTSVTTSTVPFGIANRAGVPSARRTKPSGTVTPGPVGEVSVTSVTRSLVAAPTCVVAGRLVARAAAARAEACRFMRTSWVDRLDGPRPRSIG